MKALGFVFVALTILALVVRLIDWVFGKDSENKDDFEPGKFD